MLNADDINIPEAEASAILANALNITYTIAGIIAVIVIIIAGIMMATSTGDPAGVTRARNMLLFGIIGLVIVILAFAVTAFVQGVFS